MGIKAGSGKGSIDKSGERPEVPGVGGSGRRSKKPMSLPPPPPKKPLPPVENPNQFPENKGFRLGQYRVVEERDDYLICTGYDPNAKNPASEVTPTAFRSGSLMKVAKPPALQRTMWEAGPVTIGGVEYTFEYTGLGLRTARWTDDLGDEQEEEQGIGIPYTVDGVGDVIVAVQIKKNAAVEGMEFTDEDGTRLRWIDLNVSGRHWAARVSSGTRYAELLANLSAATNFKTGATTASAKFLIADEDNPGQLIDGEVFTVTNRWVDLELALGKKLVVAKIAGEWGIIASECP